MPCISRYDHRMKSIEIMPSPPDQKHESLPDYLVESLDIVFVGMPPGEERIGHHFSDHHDKFWDLVNESELVSDLVGAENDHLILDERCGLVTLRMKKSSGPDLSPASIDIGEFIEKVERFKPKVVAFNGELTYQKVFRNKPKDFGLTDDIVGDSYVFVLPSSNSLDRSLVYQKKLHWYKKLKAILRAL